MTPLPSFIDRDTIAERLPLIFPAGTANRNYCIREMAASTIFTMLYIGAVEGREVYISPLHVYRMTSEQSLLSFEHDRITYASLSKKKNFQPTGTRWYADNTREPIRDETIREGLMQFGAVLSAPGIPTTSSKPRYALQKQFAALFDPALTGTSLDEAIQQWQRSNLTNNAIARIRLAKRSANTGGQVLIQFPNGEAKAYTAGPSTDISKAVVEKFATHFLRDPVVLWISTSDKKVQYLDQETTSAIGINIRSDQNLPDIILADLASGPDPLLVFVEVVATDGAITERRKKAIYEITDAASFRRDQILFVTAYHDRQSSGFKKTISDLGWNSFCWFVSEPEHVIYLDERTRYLSDFNTETTA